jgi:hypothetical protein
VSESVSSYLSGYSCEKGHFGTASKDISAEACSIGFVSLVPRFLRQSLVSVVTKEASNDVIFREQIPNLCLMRKNYVSLQMPVGYEIKSDAESYLHELPIFCIIG